MIDRWFSHQSFREFRSAEGTSISLFRQQLIEILNRQTIEGQIMSSISLTAPNNSYFDFISLPLSFRLLWIRLCPSPFSSIRLALMIRRIASSLLNRAR